jgi:hypothetical protein
VHLRSLVLCLAVLGVTAGCETSSDPLLGIIGGGGTLTAAQATGNWSITVTRTSNLPCSGALASGQVIATHIEVLSDGSVTSPSTWQNPIGGGFQNLTGTINLTTGAVDLIFGAGVGAAMELFPGTMSSAGSITGATITDPAPGSSQVFGSNGCQYTATGTKTS